ncbi:MAG: M15 family metallopeptidase [Candidatus Desulfacyla sp.]
MQGRAFHAQLFGLAFDVVPLDAGKPIWNVFDSFWQRVGRTGKECGLEWTGDWKRFREYAHFQYTGSVSQRSGRGRDRRRHALRYLVGFRL